MKTVKAYEVINHGVTDSSYFQGCGVLFTKYTDIATGIGWTPQEALEEALDSLVQGSWDVDGLNADFGLENDMTVEDALGFEPEEGSELHWFVSVRVR